MRTFHLQEARPPVLFDPITLGVIAVLLCGVNALLLSGRASKQEPVAQVVELSTVRARRPHR